MVRILRITLKVYKLTVSPFLATLTGGPGTGCRFTPTCSEYFVHAVERHGLLAGSWMGIKRLCRCHPWGGSGYDPVPATSRRAKEVF